MISYREYINESKITKDSFIAYDITDPSRNKYSTGFQGKRPFKSEADAKNSFGKDSKDIKVTTIKEFELKFKIKIL